MLVKLSDLFTQQQKEIVEQDKISYIPAGSSIYDASLDDDLSKIVEREPKITKNIMNQFKKQIKQSLNIINSPKSSLYGHQQNLQWTQQNFFKHTFKSMNLNKMNSEPSQGYMNQTGFSYTPSTSQKQRRLKELGSLKQAQNMFQNSKIDSVYWVNLKEEINQQLVRKSHTIKNNSNTKALKASKNTFQLIKIFQ